MRPISRNEEGGIIVEKTSGDTLSIQGLSIIEIAGQFCWFNLYFRWIYLSLWELRLLRTVLQSESGKTYTIWGPTNALLEDKSSSNEKGLTPRVFERLFSRINEEQIKQADKQLVYQCHYSFLEYADLEEKHINLLTSQRRIEDGILDVKKAAAKAGVKSAESEFQRPCSRNFNFK
nr:kinesin-like protein KIN-12B [Tanacetum cinerariifolium]